jgi:hypothetical protein
MTQQKETFITQGEIKSCEDMGSQWKIKVIWQDPSLNPKGFANDTYMTKSIKDTTPFSNGLYAFTVSRGKLKKEEFTGEKDWMYWLTTHAVNTFEQQTAIDNSKPQAAEGGTEGDWSTEPAETKAEPTHFEKIQTSKDMIIFEQVIYKGAVEVVVAQINQGIKYEDVGQAILDLNNQIKAGLFSE